MKRSVKILWRVFFGGFLLVLLLFVGANFGMLGKMPSLKQLQNPEADLASEIYSADGVLMGKYYAENRSEVKYNEISPNVINALLATEDERFYDHSGIDVQAVGRAIFTLGTQGGGSTITQQVAKLMLGQGKGNKIKRAFDKIKEWIVAVKLERNFTKEEIITLYLNRAPWGNLYGIRNASLTYFQKEPKDLKLEEAAVLVGMLKGFVYNPIGYPKASIDRRNTVINQMVVCHQHFLTEEEANKLKAKPLITNYKKIDENVGIAPYFRNELAGKLKEWCKTHTNPKTGDPYDLYRDGLKIYTTIDSRMQKYAEQAVEEHMPVIQKKLDWNLKIYGARMWKGHDNVVEAAFKYTDRWKSMKEEGISEEDIKKTFYTPVKMKVFAWNAKHEKDTVMTPFDSIKYHKQILQTNFAAMDPRTGEVKCWVGGIDYKWFKYDHVTQLRQVGSTIKPYLYTLAVDEAGYTPETVIPGGALTLGGKTISGGAGTLAYCLAWSKNVAAWRLIGQIGVKRFIEFLRTCGIDAKLQPYYSIGLGAAEIPLIEMLQGYTMFPNKGLNTEPIIMTRIEDKSGNMLEEFSSTSKQVISEADAYTMVTLMEGVIKFGTARTLSRYPLPVERAGKTGTTNDNADGWFIGYTPELIAGTWVGCDDPFLQIYQNTAGGSEMSAPRWGIFMSKVYADKKLDYGKLKTFEKPIELTNNPIYADINMDKYFMEGDSTTQDEGNGNAEDFFKTPDTPDNNPTEKTDIENKNPKAVMDSSKSKKSDNKKTTVPIKNPADDKSKKQVKQKENDY
ncbi:MAG: transglycosylase domain-containing protein [Ferruginibacter sp.]|nr:transglycosylase domain-containing protein [Bacteroidota bacterium]MBX2919406.1 transglycosylase domain-containing protein [Ferruginibacter sp.]MCB0708091.1 transglycosylase domain-containing protein [Chitinophagaceae bacterium]